MCRGRSCALKTSLNKGGGLVGADLVSAQGFLRNQEITLCRGKSCACPKAYEGITLIALIITIIILLILAMTSVALVMRNNLIKNTQYAAEEYQIAAEKEAIELAYEEWVMDNNENADLNMDGQASVDLNDNGNGWKVKFNSSKHEYAVDKDGKISGPTSSSSQGGTGGESGGGGEQGDEGQDTQYNLPKFEDIDENKTLEWDGDGDGETEEWLVVEKTESEAVIVSKDVMGSLTLGTECKWTIDGGEEELDWEDEEIKNDADIDNSGSLDELEKAVYSYNHGVEIINRYCEDLIKNAPRNSVKSLGVDEESDIEDIYESEHLQKWRSSLSGKVKCANETYSEPWATEMSDEQKKSSESYWFAARAIKDSSTDLRFYICRVYKNSAYVSEGSHLWYITYSSYYTYARTNGVRPVVSIKYPDSYK